MDAKTKNGIAFANVIVQKAQQAKIYLFTTSNNKGEHSFVFKGVADSLKLSVMAVNIESQTFSIVAKSQGFDIYTKYKVLEVR